MKSLKDIEFKNEFIQHFKGDESGDLTPRPTPGVLYSKALPTPVKSPSLIKWSESLGDDLGIKLPVEQKEIDILAGNEITATMYPYASCYAGHQFGNWAGQLGDGRAITLGEVINPDGKSFELQLKGAGPTPYSRRADGRAVLRSSVREYLMSEAMFYLGVPTTRALSLVSTGDLVLRDMFYNGNAAFEPGAIVMRVAPSFLRFGNYEILAARKELENLRALVEWTIEKHYKHIEGENRIITWFKEIVERTALLMVEWSRVGFVHGVMNTDNMSILGLTIDYGPFSFLDAYDKNFTPNTTDLPGRRYAFGKQAAVAKWNLACLAGAIAPLFNETDELTSALEEYDDKYWNMYYRMMANKIGLEELFQEDIELINDLDNLLSLTKPDMTIFFQTLIDASEQNEMKKDFRFFEKCFYDYPDLDGIQKIDEWLNKYFNRISNNKRPLIETRYIMRQVNPRFILRNYLLQGAIEGLTLGDRTLFDKLELAIQTPYSNNGDAFYALRPEWAISLPGSGVLSCSS